MATRTVTLSAANAAKSPKSALWTALELINDLVTLTTELKTDYTALLADVTAIRTAVTGITAQLDADAGVTDTDYAANNDPAALTATAIAAATVDDISTVEHGAP